MNLPEPCLASVL